MTNESRPRMMPFRTLLPQLKQELAEAKKRIGGLEAELSAVYSDKKRFEGLAIERERRIIELTAALDLMDERKRLEWVPTVVSEDVDTNYSIYTDPLIVSVAADLDCTVDELMQYAADSVGASEIKAVEGCHSAGTHNCYGDLWTCKGCGHTFCCAEGSDNMPELCNECWWKAQGEAK